MKSRATRQCTAAPWLVNLANLQHIAYLRLLMKTKDISTTETTTTAGSRIPRLDDPALQTIEKAAGYQRAKRRKLGSFCGWKLSKISAQFC